jgi:hypothetical protein
MRLRIDPQPKSSLFSSDLELVIEQRASGIPRIHIAQSVPRPDRHLLLGIVQSTAFAVQERDAESVFVDESMTVVLETDEGAKTLDPGLVIARSKDGRFGALVRGDWKRAREHARNALRYFTGTIRLDVP